MNFKDFKKNQSNIKDSIKKLIKPANNSYADDRFWSITKDTTGNGSATIRFLPQKDPSESPIVLTFRHAFQNKGKWFIEECPYTIGGKCPVCEHSSAIWNSNEDEARKFWRTKSYIANILVIKDPANPENDGKVFMFKFGKKIYDMVMNRIAPDIDEGEEEESINVFDFDEGLDFKMKLCQVSGYNNYDKSSFAFKTSAVGNGEAKKQEAIYNIIYELKEFMDESRFKTYDQLLTKLTNSQSAQTVPSIQSEFVDEVTKKPTMEEKKEKIVKKFDADTEEEGTEEEDIDFDSLLADDDD